MNPAVTVRLIIFTPLVVSTGIYCWRVGIRWNKTITIRGIPAKLAAIFLFAIATLMMLALIFPTQAVALMERVNKATRSTNRQ